MSYSIYTIPVTTTQQMFRIPLNGKYYYLKNKFNTISNLWYIDLLDIDKNPLVCGIPLVDGCDLLEQFKYLGIGIYLYVSKTIPSQTDLGVDNFLKFSVLNP